MSDWVDRFAARLAKGTDEAVEVDEDAILDLARVVAHGTERQNAPLAAFLAGQHVARREADGVSSPDALAEARRVADQLLRGGTPQD